MVGDVYSRTHDFNCPPLKICDAPPNHIKVANYNVLHYNDYTKENDICLVYLDREITFNGKH